MITENPFDDRAYGDLVFRTRPERNFFIGRLSPSQRRKWLQDYPERWQTRENALRDLQAHSRIDVEAEPPEAGSTTSCNDVQTGAEIGGRSPAPSEDTPQSDRGAANTTPLTTTNAQVTVAAGDEIIIGERRLIGERRVAAMLGYSQRQLQRWRKERKGPDSTKIGRRLFYELNTLQKWIEEKNNAGGADLADEATSHQSTNLETP